MISLRQILEERTDLSDVDKQWLVSVVHEWHLLADASFSDIVLWVPDARDDNVLIAAAQVRPTTGPTAVTEEIVGDELRYETDSLVTCAYVSHEVMSSSEHIREAGIPVESWAIPVMRDGRCIAVVERLNNLMSIRARGGLEDTYLAVAESLCDMLYHGDFPVDPPSDPSRSPKIGDGVMLIEKTGAVLYVSPNATSYLRSCGVEGEVVGEDIRKIAPDEAGAFMRRRSGRIELQAQEFLVADVEVTLRLRAIPLKINNQAVAIAVLCRDVTLLQEHERELVNKDATIREIHHRVKNNLQTVAALLRLQSRRMATPEAKGALAEAQRRVQAIATVHEILSRGFDDCVYFDEIADTLLRMVTEVADTNRSVTIRREGSFGKVPGDVATSLSLVLSELCQNAIEHGFDAEGGTVTVRAQAYDSGLDVDVIDDGAGLPEGFDAKASHSLGLSIVSTLVQDMHGTFELVNNPMKGASARVEIEWLQRTVDVI